MKKGKDKKDKSNKPEEIDPKFQEEIQKQIDQMLEEAGIDKDAVKIVAVKIPKRTIIYCLLELLFFFVMNYILFLSVNGYVEFCGNNLIRTLYISTAFTCIEVIIRNIMCIFWNKMYAKYLLFIDVISVLSAIVLVYTFPFFEISSSIFLFSTCVIAMMCVRNIIKKYTFDKFASKYLMK